MRIKNNKMAYNLISEQFQSNFRPKPNAFCVIYGVENSLAVSIVNDMELIEFICLFRLDFVWLVLFNWFGHVLGACNEQRNPTNNKFSFELVAAAVSGQCA